jgi:hypothetical protein
MLKKLSVILFLFVMLAQTFSGYVLKADYFINISSYIEKCINRDKPQLKCNGQCQLAKKMQQADDKDEGSASINAEIFNLVLSSRSYPPQLRFNIEPVEIQWIVLNANNIQRGHLRDVFQPPQLS